HPSAARGAGARKPGNTRARLVTQGQHGPTGPGAADRDASSAGNARGAPRPGSDSAAARAAGSGEEGSGTSATAPAVDEGITRDQELPASSFPLGRPRPAAARSGHPARGAGALDTDDRPQRDAARHR